MVVSRNNNFCTFHWNIWVFLFLIKYSSRIFKEKGFFAKEKCYQLNPLTGWLVTSTIKSSSFICFHQRLLPETCQKVLIYFTGKNTTSGNTLNLYIYLPFTERKKYFWFFILPRIKRIESSIILVLELLINPAIFYDNINKRKRLF